MPDGDHFLAPPRRPHHLFHEEPQALLPHRCPALLACSLPAESRGTLGVLCFSNFCLETWVRGALPYDLSPSQHLASHHSDSVSPEWSSAFSALERKQTLLELAGPLWLEDAGG